jgi:guanylate kinase
MPKLDPYDFKPSPLLIVISGPSGVGKDEAIRHLQKQGYPFYFVVTATSRPQRPNEVEGQDYLFVTTD